MLKSTKKLQKLWPLGLLLVSAYFLVLMHLDAHPLYVWDEGLFANRAYFWAEYGRYFTNWLEVPHCDLNHPNTKPPLMSLLQAASFTVFGYSPLALRLPIALSGIALAIMVFWVVSRRLALPWLALTAGLILLANQGFNSIHILRSGDHDAALALWTFLYAWCFYRFLQNGRKANALGFYVFLAFAVLTKSIAGFMLVPGLVLFTLLTGRLTFLLSQAVSYWGFGIFLLLISSFYGTMELVSPGFLQLVWDNEIDRYSTAIDNHSQPWPFYFQELYQHFSPWWIMALFGIMLCWIWPDEKVRRFLRFSAVTSIVFLLLLSLASTKLAWYIAPVYPWLAILAAFGLWYVAKRVFGELASRHHLLKHTATVVVALALTIQVGSMIAEKYKPQHYWNVMEYEWGLRKMLKEHPEYKQFTIHTRSEWYPNLIFMVNWLNDQKGYDVNLINSKKPIEVGDKLYGHKHDRFKHFHMSKLVDFGPIELRSVDSLRVPKTSPSIKPEEQP